jgi:diguanylate cyclase (GGDEF)-like protein
LVFCDMNGFKQINDRYGHRAGDQLLQLAAQRLSSAARAGDLVARIGGDEFVVLCPSVNHLEELDRIAARLTAAVSQPAQIAGVEIVPSMSVGTAIAQRGDTSNSLLARSDEAMYRNRAYHRAVAVGRP